MTEQDQNNTREHDPQQGRAERPDEQQHTGDGAAEHEEREQGERQGEQAAGTPQDEQQDSAEHDAGGSATEDSATEDSATEATATEEKPEEAEAPEDLFDLMGEEGKKHKKKKPEPPRTASAQSAAPQQKEEKKFPLGAEIAYAGHKIELPREMTGSEIVDELLADDFPELTKESTEFTHDEERNRIVPTRKALKKGANDLQRYRTQRERGGSRRSSPTADDEHEPPSLKVHTHPRKRPLPPVHRVLAHDGVYEVRDTSLGTFTTRIPAAVMMAEEAHLKVPKAPVSVLEKTLQIFRERADREAIVTIVYDRRDGLHHLVWVDQTASARAITYDSITESENLIVYGEIHSHHVMDACFSPTDDRYEVRSTGLYGVIGRVDLDRPHAAFRYSCGHHFRTIRAGSLFDEPVRVAELVTEVPG